LQSYTKDFTDFYDDGSLSLPIYNGRSPTDLGGDNSNVITLSSDLTGGSSTITLILWPESTMTATSTAFIIKLPSGFSINKNSMECKVNYVI